MEQEPTSGSGYGKRPLWQWVIIYVILAIIVYGLIYYFIFSKGGSYTPSPSQTYTPPVQQTSQSTSPSPIEAQNIVTYTDSGFSPSILSVKKGSTVTFKNTASDDMRVASNPHPIHNGYPTMGGCVSSTFDSCKNISPGQSWSFKFDIVGTWGYHNHLNPSEGGEVVVQ
jgi:plastocyanin